MLVTIKPHSTLQKYFNGDNLKADLYCYADIMDYIRSMHTRFTKYIHIQANNGLQETFTILDKNLRELTAEELYMRKPHKDDVLYIVPTILGGGGKRGGLALIAVAALIFFAPALLAASGVTIGGATTAAGIGGVSLLGGTIASVTGSLGLNLALMGVSMLLAPKKPDTPTSRDNNAFGSLVNTTSSGIPVGLHYGQVRVAGQIISGYTRTINKGEGDNVPLTDILSL